MPGNFGIPSDGARLDLLADVTDANSELLESVIEALLHPVSLVLTDNECLLDRVGKHLKRLFGKETSDNDVQLHRIVDALYAHLALVSGANEDELNRALAIASQLNPAGDVLPEALQPVAQPQDIQDVLLAQQPAALVGGGLLNVGAPPPAQPAGVQDALAAAIDFFGLDVKEGDQPAAAPFARPASVPCGPGGSEWTLPDILQKGLPIPGSAAFYEQIDSYIAVFEDIGNIVVGAIQHDLTPEKLIRALRNMGGGEKQRAANTLVSKVVLDAMEWLLAHSAPVTQTIQRAVTCAWELAKVLTPDCRLGVVLGLTVARGVVRTIADIEGGWDAFVWAIAHVRIEVPTVETFLDHLLAYACPMELPSPAEATEAWVQGRITQDRRDVIYRWAGINPETYDAIARSRLERVQPHEYIQYLRRTGVSEEGQVALLTERVFHDREEAAAFVKLYDELPTIQDHLHFLQRNVFDDQYVKDYELDSGFVERFWPKFGAQLRALGMTEEIARLHYEAHWINASPEQMREFVYRLRPDKVGDAASFTAQDYERLLAEQDYSPKQRAWFTATLFRVPALGYLRDQYRQNLLTDEQMQGYHRDLGYSEDDSKRFVAIDKLQRDRMRATQAHGWNPAALAKAYALRQKDGLFVVDQMEALGYTREEAIALMERADIEIQGQVVTRARSRLLSRAVSQIGSAIRVGVLDVDAAASTLMRLGFPETQARGVAQLESATAQTERIKHAIGQLRSAFHRGEVDAVFCSQQLRSLGVVDSVVRAYVSAWLLERTPDRKRRTAAKIVSDVAEAQLSTEEALVRLQNLGYEDADRQLYLADARRRTVEIRADRNIAETLSGTARMNVQAQLARTSDRLSKRLITDLQKSAPIPKLQKWAKLGVIRKDEFYSRMRLYGIEESTIELWWKDACSAKDAQCEGSETPAVSPQANGQGSDTAGSAASGPAAPVPPSGQ